MRSTLRSVLAVTVVVTAGCAGTYPLGSVDEDNKSVSEIPELQHVQRALRDDGLKVKDLFSKRNVVFDRAPDPSELLKGYQVTNDARSHDGVLLNVLTYNVALLKAEPFGISYAVSPEQDTRLPELPRRLMTRGFDIICLQEVWHAYGLDAFKDKAPRHGYRVFAQDRAQYTDGLVILVREAILSPDMEPTLENVAYDAQDPKEFWPGPKVKRGYLRLSFRHPALGVLHVYNTHTQPYQEAWMNRMKEGRQLGIAVKQATADGEIALVTGDMNAGPYYRDDTWTRPDEGKAPEEVLLHGLSTAMTLANGGKTDGKTDQRWWANSVSYAVTLAYGGMSDLFAMGMEAQDVFLGNTVVNRWQDAARIPGSVEGWCARTPKVVFTATDCNELYFRQYAGTEYPARLDHLMARDPQARIRVVGSALEFTERFEWEAGSFELSDHYGVSTSLVVRPPL